MRHGERPDGANYFPAFPYASFTRITDEDLGHLWAYLRSLPPHSRSNRPHELGFFYQWRPLVSMWKWLYFTPGRSDELAEPHVRRGERVHPVVVELGAQPGHQVTHNTVTPSPDTAASM